MFLQFLRPDIILHKLGDQGFYFIKYTGFFHLTAKIGKGILKTRSDFTQDHGFSHIGQKIQIITTCLLKNPVGKPQETQNIDIQDSSGRKVVGGVEDQPVSCLEAHFSGNQHLNLGQVNGNAV